MSYVSTQGTRRSIRLSDSMENNISTPLSMSSELTNLPNNNITMSWSDFQDTFYKSNNWMSRYNLGDTLMFRSKNYYNMDNSSSDEDDNKPCNSNDTSLFVKKDFDSLSVSTTETVLNDRVYSRSFNNRYNLRNIDCIDYSHYFNDEDDENGNDDNITNTPNNYVKQYNLRQNTKVNYSSFYKLYPKNIKQITGKSNIRKSPRIASLPTVNYFE